MSQGYIGEVRAFGFNFAPANWMLCNGQTLAISSYTALFSILGTTYGGNGTSTFQLPNLQGQVPMHWGTAAGLPTTVIGQPQGQPTVTLTTAQLPAHTHVANAGTGTGKTASPGATSYLGTSAPSAVWQKTPTIGPQFASNAISLVGGNIPHDNMQPFLVISFCICFNGYFPSRG
jgi:microcystin-dependent protein